MKLLKDVIMEYYVYLKRVLRILLISIGNLNLLSIKNMNKTIVETIRKPLSNDIAKLISIWVYIPRVYIKAY